MGCGPVQFGDFPVLKLVIHQLWIRFSRCALRDCCFSTPCLYRLHKKRYGSHKILTLKWKIEFVCRSESCWELHKVTTTLRRQTAKERLWWNHHNKTSGAHVRVRLSVSKFTTTAHKSNLHACRLLYRNPLRCVCGCYVCTLLSCSVTFLFSADFFPASRLVFFLCPLHFSTPQHTASNLSIHLSFLSTHSFMFAYTY